MACFTVTAAAGVGVAIARHIVKHHEKKLIVENKEPSTEKFGSDIKLSKKLAYLELPLLTGSFVLAIEHIIHGEIVPFPPFFTAASDPTSAMEMLHEMGTVGGAMLGAIVLAWAIGVLAIDFFKFKKRKSSKQLKSVEAK